MDGGEFIDKLEQRSKARAEAGFSVAAPPPVLIITGDPYNVSPIYTSGLVKGVLCKPFTLKEVLASVEACIGDTSSAISFDPRHILFDNNFELE